MFCVILTREDAPTVTGSKRSSWPQRQSGVLDADLASIESVAAHQASNIPLVLRQPRRDRTRLFSLLRTVELLSDARQHIGV